MPLDPQARMLLDELERAGAMDVANLSPTEARAQMRSFLPAVREPIQEVHDLLVPTQDGLLRVRRYSPSARHLLPGLVYFHGGGWVTGDLESADGVCRALARTAGCRVFAVDYRLAPEHPFPVPLEDCYAVTAWLQSRAHELGIYPGDVSVGGDSAGANLAIGVGLLARERGTPLPIFQLLITPAVDASGHSRSYGDFSEGYLLSSAELQWYWRHYVPCESDRSNPMASPIRADLRGLSPALIITAEFDPLRDEGEAFGERLLDADVPVVVTRYRGMIHTFFARSELHQGRAALAQAAIALRQAFRSPAASLEEVIQ
jgi:acetyl esterase